MVKELQEFARVPDNDDCNVVPPQLGFLAEVQATLGRPENKIADLGEGRAVLAQWLAEAIARQAVEAKVGADSEATTDLSPEQVETMKILRERYERNEHGIPCHNEVPWEKIERILKANPAKLNALRKMNSTGGVPDVTKVQGKSIFFDDLARIPSEERSFLNYHEAVRLAEQMGDGVHLMRPEHYLYITNELGIKIGYVVPSWLNTSHEPESLREHNVFIGFNGKLKRRDAYLGNTSDIRSYFSITISEPELDQVPDDNDCNIDPTTAKAQADFLALAQATLARPEAKIADLGAFRAILAKWLAEVIARQAMEAKVGADSEATTDLSPEQVTFIGILKTRYGKNEHGIPCHDKVSWEIIEKKLKANPEKLNALREMNARGGFPDVTEVQGERIFFDTLRIVKDWRGHLNYHKAVRLAAEMGDGVHLMSPERYLYITNELGIKIHGPGTWTWLDTSHEPGLLERGKALSGSQTVDPMSTIVEGSVFHRHSNHTAHYSIIL